MKWLSWSNVVLGLWLIGAPFALGYSSAHGAGTEDVLLGMIIAGFALWRAVGPETAEMRSVSWIVTTAGLWVIIAPYALGYSGAHLAVANETIVGLLVLTCGGVRAMAPARAVAAR